MSLLVDATSVGQEQKAPSPSPTHNNEANASTGMKSALVSTLLIAENQAMVEVNSQNDHDGPNQSNNVTDSELESTVVTNDEILSWSPDMRDQLIQELQQQNKVEPRNVYVGEERILSKILSSGQLVVPVDHGYALWFDGYIRLCNLLRRMTLVSTLSETLPQQTLLLPPPLLNMTFDLEGLGYLGQGNYITSIYAARLSVAYAKVEFHFQTKQQQNSSWYEYDLLPWFRVVQPAPTLDNPWPFDGGLPNSEEEVCCSHSHLLIDRMAHTIQAEVRAMAWQLVEPPSYLLEEDSTENIGSRFAPQEISFPVPFSRIANITLDDVAIHFRCGDIMGSCDRSDYGIIAYSEYSKRIFENTTSIGILTHPFDKQLTRSMDSSKTEDCKDAVYLLVEYLQDHFPHATITIRNSARDTLPLTYARIVMAKQAFTSLSSFGIFPVVATYGMGYFQQGNEGVNAYTGGLPHFLSNLHEMRAPVLTSGMILRMGLNATLAWLVNDKDVRRK
jgi:hypothetical protein